MQTNFYISVGEQLIQPLTLLRVEKLLLRQYGTIEITSFRSFSRFKILIWDIRLVIM